MFDLNYWCELWADVPEIVNTYFHMSHWHNVLYNFISIDPLFLFVGKITANNDNYKVYILYYSLHCEYYDREYCLKLNWK